LIFICHFLCIYAFKRNLLHLLVMTDIFYARKRVTYRFRF